MLFRPLNGDYESIKYRIVFRCPNVKMQRDRYILTRIQMTKHRKRQSVVRVSIKYITTNQIVAQYERIEPFIEMKKEKFDKHNQV